MTKKKKPAKRKKANPDLSERDFDDVVGALLKVPPKDIKKKTKRSHITKPKIRDY